MLRFVAVSIQPPLKLRKIYFLIRLFFRSEKIEIVMPKAEGERVKMKTITGNWIKQNNNRVNFFF